MIASKTRELLSVKIAIEIRMIVICNNDIPTFINDCLTNRKSG